MGSPRATRGMSSITGAPFETTHCWVLPPLQSVGAPPEELPALGLSAPRKLPQLWAVRAQRQ
eukprot:1368557-Alexandrium_andersonii.AAC.1